MIGRDVWLDNNGDMVVHEDDEGEEYLFRDDFREAIRLMMSGMTWQEIAGVIQDAGIEMYDRE